MGDVIDIGRGRGPGSRFPVAVGKTIRTHFVENKEYTWPEFIRARLEKPKITAETVREYKEMSVDAQGSAKDVGYFVPGFFEGGIRKRDNLAERWLGCLDIDHAKDDYAFWIQYAYSGLAYVLHSTHKHRVDAPRLRLIFPLSRACTEIEYQAAMRRLAEWWDIDVFDHTGFQFSRVMHFPSIPKDAHYVFQEAQGKFVDVDALLATYKDFNDLASWPVTEKEKKIVPHQHTKRVQNPLEKGGLIGAFCQAYTIVEAMEIFIPDAYLPGNAPDRFTYSKASGANGAIVYDDVTLYSWHETDPCGGQLVNAWDMVRLHEFGHKDKDVERDTKTYERPSFKKMQALAKSDEKTSQIYAAEHHRLIAAEFEDFDLDDIEIDIEEEDDSDEDELPTLRKPPPKKDSKAPPKWKFRVADGEFIKSSIHNVIGFLETVPDLIGCIRHNLFSDEILQMRALPGMKGACPAPWTDLAEVSIKSYLDRRHAVCFATTLIHEACMRVANRHSFNPQREWLDALVWDGKPRLERVFIDFLGAPDTPYVRAATVKWFCQAVARLKHPGCQADHMLVIEGVEGLMKSSMLRVLAKGWFTDDFSLGLDSKEIVEKTRDVWIVEVQEMMTRANANSQHVKAFISRRSERVRLAYGRNASEYPRHFVLAGTTNEDNYLQGVTGNRRTWPIKTDGRAIDIPKLERVVDDLWAEAVERLAGGEALFMDKPELLEAARAEQQGRVEVDEWTGVIAAWAQKLIPEDYWKQAPGSPRDFDDEGAMVKRDRVCVPEVWTECLQGEMVRLGGREARRIGDILRGLGWVPHNSMKFGNRYRRSKGFVRGKGR